MRCLGRRIPPKPTLTLSHRDWRPRREPQGVDDPDLPLARGAGLPWLRGPGLGYLRGRAYGPPVEYGYQPLLYNGYVVYYTDIGEPYYWLRRCPGLGPHLCPRPLPGALAPISRSIPPGTSTAGPITRPAIPRSRQSPWSTPGGREPTGRTPLGPWVAPRPLLRRPYGAPHYRDGNPPGPVGGPGTNWENRPGPLAVQALPRTAGLGRGATATATAIPRDRRGAGDQLGEPTRAFRRAGASPDRSPGATRYPDRDGNPPGPAGGPATNWENRPGPSGGPGASPDRQALARQQQAQAQAQTRQQQQAQAQTQTRQQQQAQAQAQTRQQQQAQAQAQTRQQQQAQAQTERSSSNRPKLRPRPRPRPRHRPTQKPRKSAAKRPRADGADPRRLDLLPPDWAGFV